MSTFLHYVHCKDALLDCSAPGGERCESLTWVDEITHLIWLLRERRRLFNRRRWNYFIAVLLHPTNDYGCNYIYMPLSELFSTMGPSWWLSDTWQQCVITLLGRIRTQFPRSISLYHLCDIYIRIMFHKAMFRLKAVSLSSQYCFKIDWYRVQVLCITFIDQLRPV